MHFSFASVLSQFKRNWTEYLLPETLQRLCREAGLVWRERVLPPATTIQLMLVQILHGNCALAEIPHIANRRFSAAAFCYARMRIPLIFFERLVEQLAASLQEEDFNARRWKGHRVFVCDGSGVSMSDEKELADYFGYPPTQRPTCGFPGAKLLFMFHIGSGMITKLLIKPFRAGEISSVSEFHSEMTHGDLLLADRAYCSYHHFCLIFERGLHALIRMHQNLIADFTPNRPYFPPGEIPCRLKCPKSRQIRLLGKTDQLIEWFKSTSRPRWMSKELHRSLPASITVRQLQYQIEQPGFRTRSVVILTTLLSSEEYSSSDIAKLYFKRWEIETNFDHLKTTMKMDVLKARTVDGIKKELLCYVIVYNLVRLVMLKAANSQRVAQSEISFADALRWLIHSSPHKKLPPLLLVPCRPGRMEPRTKKRRDKPYPYMIESRATLRNRKTSQHFTGLS